MKKFNLKKALEGERVTTRDGHSVILTGADIGHAYVLQGVIDFDTNLDVASWSLNGRYRLGEECDLDLFML